MMRHIRSQIKYSKAVKSLVDALKNMLNVVIYMCPILTEIWLCSFVQQYSFFLFIISLAFDKHHFVGQ